MLQTLNRDSILDYLFEIQDNGDMYGYASDEDGYYQEYKDQFDDLSDGAYYLIEALRDFDIRGNFRKVLTTLILFYDIKAAHDCLTSIVTELDERAAMMETGQAPQRAYVE